MTSCQCCYFWIDSSNISIFFIHMSSTFVLLALWYQFYFMSQDMLCHTKFLIWSLPVFPGELNA